LAAKSSCARTKETAHAKSVIKNAVNVGKADLMKPRPFSSSVAPGS
jgi:hypothetical protein